MIVPDRVTVQSYEWPEITSGTDLAALLSDTVALSDGDIVVVTSKIIAKAEGLLTTEDRDDVIARSTSRVVARRGPMVIVETHHGFVLAAAGVDGSNIGGGAWLPLPRDPDQSARDLRAAVLERIGRNVAIVVSDTVGRPWRNGQTDVAIGAAGIDALVDLRGQADTHGNTLVVTMPAVVDEIAAAADLVKGKTSRRPVAVLRGLDTAVLPAGSHGRGVAELIRDGASDLFGFGARDAVIAAVTRDPADLNHFAAIDEHDLDPFSHLASARDDVRLAVSDADVSSGVRAWLLAIDVDSGSADLPAAWVEVGRLLEQARTLGAAHRLRETPSPGDEAAPADGWRRFVSSHWSVA